MTYDQINPVLRRVLGCFEGFRKVGFRADDLYCEPARSPGLPAGQLAVFITLKTQGQEFRIECGQWDESAVDDLRVQWRATCQAVNADEVPQADMDRIWQESVIFADSVGFVLALGRKGIRPPKTLS